MVPVRTLNAGPSPKYFGYKRGTGGRKPKMTPAQFTMAEIAASCGVTPMTIPVSAHDNAIVLIPAGRSTTVTNDPLPAPTALPPGRSPLVGPGHDRPFGI